MKYKRNLLAARMSAVMLILSAITCLTSCNMAKNTSADTAMQETIPLEVITLPEETTTEPETTPPDVEIDLLMIGDILAHEGVYNSGLQADGTYNFDHLFKNILSDTAAADINVVNQEVILGGTELGLSAYPCFNSPYEIGDAEVKAGFNVILGASNHPLDKGLKGLNNCLNFWKTKHPDTLVLGINDTEEDYNRINIYEKDGFKIALLNYTYGTNGIPLPDSKPYCVNLLDVDKITSDVSKAKELADMVVVFPHWGTEYAHTPDSNQTYLTNIFLDLGVDLVIGDHPHVIEPVETLTRADGHQMVVFYSIGNFVSNQNQKPRMIGGMAKATLVKRKTDGSCYIKEYSMTPVITHVLFGTGLITTYKLSDYTDALADKNWIKTKEGCHDFSVAYCQSLCSQVLGEDYNQEKCSLNVKLR
ncbi:MAG: CapA family protein [Eubacteriales bacterium]|nr:CapA family protein [Eubacteriales bacterium]